MPTPFRREPTFLAGSLESFPLPDVLALLAATGKTGALAVSGGATSARLFVDEGAVVAAEGGRGTGPVEVVAELLALESGDFVFEPDELAEQPGPPIAIPSLLSEVRARRDESRAIEAVLPSVDHGVVLATRAPAGEIVLSGAEWQAVAAVAGGGPLGLMLGRLADDALDALRLMKGLIDRGLLDVVEPPADEPEYDELEFDGPEPEPEVDEPEVDEPEVDEPEFGEPLAVGMVSPAGGPPVILVRAGKTVPRVTDPALQVRLDALAEQFEAVYDAQTAAIDGAEVPSPRRGLFAKRRHRSDS